MERGDGIRNATGVRTGVGNACGDRMGAVMSDLVERLRSPNALPLVRPTKLEREAADHIERLAHANKVQAEEIQEILERLAAVERDVARMDWLDRNPQVILRSGKQHVRPLIDAAMRAAEFSASGGAE